MNPLLSSSATCVAQGKRACNLDSPIDFIADFPWCGRGGEWSKYERVERGGGQQKLISLASTLVLVLVRNIIIIIIYTSIYIYIYIYTYIYIPFVVS